MSGSQHPGFQHHGHRPPRVVVPIPPTRGEILVEPRNCANVFRALVPCPVARIAIVGGIPATMPPSSLYARCIAYEVETDNELFDILVNNAGINAVVPRELNAIQRPEGDTHFYYAWFNPIFRRPGLFGLKMQFFLHVGDLGADCHLLELVTETHTTVHPADAEEVEPNEENESERQVIDSLQAAGVISHG